MSPGTRRYVDRLLARKDAANPLAWRGKVKVAPPEGGPVNDQPAKAPAPGKQLRKGEPI